MANENKVGCKTAAAHPPSVLQARTLQTDERTLMEELCLSTVLLSGIQFALAFDYIPLVVAS